MNGFIKGPVDWEVNLKNWGSMDRIDWRKRTIAVRKLLGDGVRSVIDVGAGSMFLGRLLPLNVKYYPLDHEPRCDETLVCDLNAYQFPDVKADAAVLAGILGYLNDVDWLFDTLAERVSMIVLSYQGKEKGFDHSLFTTDEIINKLRRRGFILTDWDRDMEEQWPLLARFEKARPERLAANYFCTGCGACVNTCPAGAIELKPDHQGYLKPQVDGAKCVGCNQCVEVCPSVYIHENGHYAEPDCYAAWAQDDIRLDSSSGGAFSVLAQSFLRQGGAVFGAAWTEGFYLAHKGITSVESLAELRHSKYVQSNTKDTFRQARELLEGGKPVLYVGTPCQISGLHAFLGKQYEGLYTIDLVCFCSGGGVDTMFRKYLSEQYGIENIQNVVFRDKQFGWRGDAHSIQKKDGSVILLGIDTDVYQKAYHNVLIRNKTCENCRFADFPRQGDVTLGDFWGVEQHDPSWNDGKGTSLIFVNSEKGRRLLDTVQGDFQRIERVPSEWSRGKGNRIGKDGRPRHKRAEDFLNSLNNGKYSFKELVDETLRDTRDIGLVCLHNNNFGNNLTNYALYRYLNDAGYSVAMIDQAQDAPWTPYAVKLSLFGHIPYKEADLFPSAGNKIQQKELNDRCGCFIVGSDQLFRAVFAEGLGLHACMDWVASNKLKVSYATSFGVERFEGDPTLKAKMGYFLKRFQAISVREASGVEILKKNFGIPDGACVLDPVFLCDKRCYEDMARFGKMRLPPNAFGGGYILDLSEKKAEFMRKVLRENGLESISVISDAELPEQSVSDFWDKAILKAPLVEEWLANVLYSDVFVTDSFHGVCFAIILEKDFWIVTDEDCWRGGDRLRNLVGMLELEDRLIFEGADWSSVDLKKHIDYSKVTRLLEQKREESKKWLEDALKLRNTFSESYSTYDILGERIDGHTVRFQELERKMTDSEQRLEGRMADSEQRLEGRMTDSEQRFDGRMADSEQRLEGRMADVAAQLRETVSASLERNQAFEQELGQQLQQLQGLLEAERRRSLEAEQKLELVLQEKAGLEAQIASLFQSNSWQITWPLRKARAVLRRLFGRRPG